MTDTEALDYLETRAARHGMTVHDLLDMTPPSVADCPQEACVFWEGKHISHIQPKSVYPEIAQDPSNMMPEDPTPNMERGAQTMTQVEVFMAELDNWLDAQLIDLGMSNDSFISVF